MPQPEPGQRTYPLVGPGEHRAPDYGRVVAALSTDDLRDEVALCRGEAGYLAAARDELARRDAR